MKNGKYGFGIIGLGAIAKFHAEAVESLDDAYLAAAFDMVPGRAQSFCSDKTGVKAYDKIDAFLSDPEIDIVTVTTPSGAHMDVALAAMNAGKNVIVEKPMEITTERIDKLIECSKKNHVMLSGVFQSRFHDAPKLVKQAIEEGRFGRLTLINAQVKWYRSQDYYDKVIWHGTWKMDGGGALMNQSIHAIDLLQWFGGPVAEIEGQTALLGHQRIEVEDTGAAVLKFRSGAIGVIEGSTAVYPGFLKKLEICGTKGSAVIEEESLKYWQFEDEKPEDAGIREKYLNSTSSGGGANDPNAISFVGHARCFENVINALRTGTEPEITGEEARKAVQIICSIYKSAQSGQKVVL
ncbi:MAG: Gfo/Idh/MocA family oxidoreductase [Sphaerochaetaceae bacterium]|nr:Gfo/Idh/MocA family oxidoreductase [Sphaerochaetaceae bacterium]MDD4397025.1 Gfo/Idh/MocA family oxidoreductase [Sphaerochaetaceae bacterium]